MFPFALTPSNTCHGCMMQAGIPCAWNRSGESKAGLEGLLLLLRRVRLIAERNAATPAERLLDDSLRLLAAATGQPDNREYLEVSHSALICAACSTCCHCCQGSQCSTGRVPLAGAAVSAGCRL